MSGIAFVTHPSVRIKGSENVYSPVQCVDDLCPIGPPHMHCPFCVKTESYTDPVILKAHYRVKHVDKGIEFAGLKILRCCEHCDIVGVIKGEKKFKGAHWHCYRCRNGFNRRDEAIKHYKTHFRNPQTTFQISITSDLNSPVPTYQQSQDPPRTQQPSSNIQTSQPDNTLPANHEIIHPALTEAISCISPVAVGEQDMGSSTVALTNGKVHDGAVHVSIEAACNSVDVTNDEEQAIIVIQEQQLDSSDLESSFAPIVNNEVSIVSEKEGQEKGGSMAERVQLLEQDKVLLKREVQKLRKQVEKLEDMVRTCKKREEELTVRLGNASERGITEMLQKMESEHRSLLRQQLDTLHQAYVASRSPSSSTVLQLTDQSGQEIQVVSAASLEAFLASTVNTTSTSEGHATLPTTTIIQAGDLTLEQVTGPSSNNTAGVTTTQTLTSSNTELGSGSYVMCVQSVKTEKEDPGGEQEEEEEEEEEEVVVGKEKVASEVKPPVDDTAKTEEPPAKKAKTK